MTVESDWAVGIDERVRLRQIMIENRVGKIIVKQEDIEQLQQGEQ